MARIQQTQVPHRENCLLINGNWYQVDRLTYLKYHIFAEKPYLEGFFYFVNAVVKHHQPIGRD